MDEPGTCRETHGAAGVHMDEKISHMHFSFVPPAARKEMTRRKRPREPRSICRRFSYVWDETPERRRMTIAQRTRPKPNYRFHDPNPPGVAADYLVKLLAEVNMPRAKRAVCAAAEEAAAKRSRESAPERDAKPAQTRGAAKSTGGEL